MIDRAEQMAVGTISSLLWKFSLPAITGLLVNAMYNIVDRIFVGRGVGDLALAGITVGFPLMIIFMACAMLIGVGSTSLISIRLGEQRKAEAEQIVGNALILLIIIGFSLTILGLIYLQPLLGFFGASTEVMPYAVDYMRIILLGNVLMAVGIGMNNFIRAEGNPKIAMYTMLIGAITNAILDYIFIFIFHLGIKGAAYATVISYAITTTWVLYYFLFGDSILKIHLANLKLRLNVVKNIVIIGSPAFIMHVTSSIQNLILNRSLVYYGGDIALSAIGIVMSISTLLVMPVIGISQGAQPIIGFNYGAKQYHRVKTTLKLAILAATFIVTTGFIISRIWAVELVSLFNENPELIELGTHAVLTFFMFLPVVGIQIIGSSYFQAIGKPLQATILSLSRQILLFIPLLLILPLFWGLEGIWRAAPIADLGAFLITSTWLWFEIKNLGVRDNEKVKKSYT